MEDLTGQKLGKYEVVGTLGRGGMAVVYRAEDPTIGRFVALKVLPRNYSSDPEFIGRFTQEARVIAQLDHPHILPVYDFGSQDGFTYMVMPLMERGTLADEIAGKPLGLPSIKRVIRQLASALDYAHHKGVVHRDLKPANVLIDESDNCRLTDFGIAKLVEATTSFTMTGGLMGTPLYMSPEQALGEPADARSDVYALGVIVYELATGRVPFLGKTPVAVTMAHVNQVPRSPRELNASVGEDVERVILRALAKKPDERYSSAGELASALSEAREATVPAPPPAAPKPITLEEPARPSLEDLETVLPPRDEAREAREAEERAAEQAERERAEREAKQREEREAREKAEREAAEERRRAEAEAEARRRQEEARQRQEEERARAAAEEERQKEVEARRQREEEAERKQREEEARKRQAEAERKRREEEDNARREEAERKRREAEERKRREEAERARAEAEKAAREEEKRKRAAAKELERRQAEERKRREQAERDRKRAEARARKARERAARPPPNWKARIGAAVAVVVLAAVGYGIQRSGILDPEVRRLRAAGAQVEELVEQADAAETEGELGQAIAALDSALGVIEVEGLDPGLAAPLTDRRAALDAERERRAEEQRRKLAAEEAERQRLATLERERLEQERIRQEEAAARSEAERLARVEADRQIEALLADARGALEARRFVRPADGSAVARYREVLGRRPGETRARQGLREARDGALAVATEAEQGGRLDEAVRELEAAVAAFPDDTALEQRLASVRSKRQTLAEQQRAERERLERERAERERAERAARAREEERRRLAAEEAERRRAEQEAEAAEAARRAREAEEARRRAEEAREDPEPPPEKPPKPPSISF